MKKIRQFNLFGIRFLNGDYVYIMQQLNKGSFMVVPSGPGLASMDLDEKYAESIRNSDFAIPDSGFMVLLIKIFFRKHILKFSGAKFIKLFLKESILKEKNTLFLIDPSLDESITNREYLNSLGIPIQQEYQYVAPIYNKENIEDSILLNKLKNLDTRPKYIMINIAGGIQEKLGYYLKKNFSNSTSLICTGAAIAFLTGKQAKIPSFIDNMYLGWFARIVQNPKLYTIRYIKAFRLFYMFYHNANNKEFSIE